MGGSWVERRGMCGGDCVEGVMWWSWWRVGLRQMGVGQYLVQQRLPESCVRSDELCFKLIFLMSLAGLP